MKLFHDRPFPPRLLLDLAIILAASFALVDLGYRLFLLQFLPLPLSPRQTAALPAMHTAGPRALPAQEIAGRGIFRTLSFFAVADNNRAAPAAATGLRLAGILAGGAGRAIIEEGGRQLLLKKGDTVAGYEIVAISAKGVRLKSREREILLHPEAGRGQAQTPVQLPGITKKNEADRELSLAEVTGELQNLHALLAKVRVLPHFSPDGRPAGLKIASVLPGSLLSRAGIENNDILRAVNNAPIVSPDDMILFYNDLRAGLPITLSLLRNDKPTEIAIRIRK